MNKKQERDARLKEQRQIIQEALKIADENISELLSKGGIDLNAKNT